MLSSHCKLKNASKLCVTVKSKRQRSILNKPNIIIFLTLYNTCMYLFYIYVNDYTCTVYNSKSIAYNGIITSHYIT